MQPSIGRSWRIMIQYGAQNEEPGLIKDFSGSCCDAQLEPFFFLLREASGRVDRNMAIFVFVGTAAQLDRRVGAEVFRVQTELGELCIDQRAPLVSIKA
jgi:hypothetical protein